MASLFSCASFSTFKPTIVSEDMDMSLQHLELSWDYADLSIDLDLEVVCCICSNTVGLFEDVLVCKCCQNSAHQTCTESGEAATWSCSSCEWTNDHLEGDYYLDLSGPPTTDRIEEDCYLKSTVTTDRIEEDCYLESTGTTDRIEEDCYLESTGTTDRIEDWYLKLTGSTDRIEDCHPELTGSTDRVEDYMESTGSTDRVEDYMESTGTTDRIEDYLELAGTTDRIEDCYLESTGTANRVEDDCHQGEINLYRPTTDPEPLGIEEPFREHVSSIVLGYQLDPADPYPSVLINPITLRMDLGYWSCGHSGYTRFLYSNDFSDLLFPSPDLFALLEIAVSPSGDDLELLNLFLSDFKHFCNGRHFDILQNTSPKLYTEFNPSFMGGIKAKWRLRIA